VRFRHGAAGGGVGHPLQRFENLLLGYVGHRDRLFPYQG
jgi:hypothetical protein